MVKWGERLQNSDDETLRHLITFIYIVKVVEVIVCCMMVLSLMSIIYGLLLYQACVLCAFEDI